MDFEWDENKAERNARKHGITFDEAATVFQDPRSPDHSEGEDRYITIGRTEEGEVIAVAHTNRNDTIRIINARPATKREREAYEEEA